ncbi:MAG: FkbM family methyltransferase [Deltaproteobacteria bacterium]|nr:FkbM family methyltransferase [Deltaproteobacteria bacterium]
MSEREARFAFHAGLEWGDSEIAYRFGLAESAVSSHLTADLGDKGLRWEDVEPYGSIGVPLRSRWRLDELIGEVDEYFDLGAVIPRGAVVFDVGANIGAFALAAARRCDSQFELYCFEPVPPIFRALTANSQQNALLADVKTNLFQIALGADPRTTGVNLSYFRSLPTDSTIDIDSKRRDFEAFFAHHGSELRKKAAPIVSDPVARAMGAFVTWMPTGAVGHWVSDRVSGRVEYECPMTTLSTVVDQHDVRRIDLLKVDVEGAELDVLRGIHDAHWALIDQVVLEGHDHDGELDTIRSMLVRQGFEIVRLDRPNAAVDQGLPSFLIYARRPA